MDRERLQFHSYECFHVLVVLLLMGKPPCKKYKLSEFLFPLHSEVGVLHYQGQHYKWTHAL